jgi:hypothetical protein
MRGSDAEHHALPAPTVWPMVAALAVTLMGAAFVTHAVVGLVGLVLAVASGIGWWKQVLPEEQVERVPLAVLAERALPVVRAKAGVEHLQLG